MISVYIQTSFFGIDQKKTYVNASKVSKCIKKDVQIELNDYNFINIKEFIKSLNDAGIYPGIHTYYFISILIRYFGMVSIPMFEDCSRFCCTVATSTINENTLFPSTLSMFQDKLYQQIILIIMKEISHA